MGSSLIFSLHREALFISLFPNFSFMATSIFSRIEALTKGYPLYSQSEKEDPIVLAKIFDQF